VKGQGLQEREAKKEGLTHHKKFFQERRARRRPVEAGNRKFKKKKARQWGKSPMGEEETKTDLNCSARGKNEGPTQTQWMGISREFCTGQQFFERHKGTARKKTKKKKLGKPRMTKAHASRGDHEEPNLKKGVGGGSYGGKHGATLFQRGGRQRDREIIWKKKKKTSDGKTSNLKTKTKPTAGTRKLVVGGKVKGRWFAPYTPSHREKTNGSPRKGEGLLINRREDAKKKNNGQQVGGGGTL